MADWNASIYHLPSTQSIAFKFFSESVKEIEKQIHSTAGLNFFTTEQIDFIVLICDQFQKLVKLRSRSKLIDNLLTYNFPEFFKPAEVNYFRPVVEPVGYRPVLEPAGYRPVLEPGDCQKVQSLGKQTENKFTFVCDVCDEDVPILDNDLNYSTQLHLSSPYHLEVVSVLRKIKETETCASSVAGSSLKPTFLEPENGPEEVIPVPGNASNGAKFAPRIVSNSKILPQPSKPSPAPVAISKGELSFQRFSWIQSQRQDQYLLWRRSQYYCCLCDAYLPTQHNFDSHVRGYTHKTNVAAERTMANSSGETSARNISGNDKESGRSPVITRTRSASNESRTSQVKTDTKNTSDNQNNQVVAVDNGVRVCTLCSVRMPSEANFVSHMNSNAHRAKVMIFQKTFDALTKALNDVTGSATSASSSTSNANVKSNAAKNGTSDTFQEWLVTRDGTEYCGLCNVKVPGPAQRDSHFNGSLHIGQLKTVTKPVNKSFTDFIIIKEDQRYCILCNLKLASEAQVASHKYGKTHKGNLKKYEENYLS